MNCTQKSNKKKSAAIIKTIRKLNRKKGQFNTLHPSINDCRRRLKNQEKKIRN